jgi:hypothetical protein
MRGGENVLLSLARLFPEAPIFTLLHVRGSVAPELEARDIRTTFVQRLPGVERRYRYYLPLFPAAAAAMDLRGFDLVISSSHCAAKGAKADAGALHLCYCHTPMRYVWDRYDDYFGPGRLRGPARWLVPVAAEALRAWDVASSARVGRFAANSAYVAGRLEAYRGTGRPVRIVGDGPEEKRLRARAPSEATFLGRVSNEELREAYRGCRAVLMPGVEDFGIVPLEAMACGRPAVVFAEGGAVESVLDGTTGLHFREPTAAALRAAIDSLDGVGFNGVTLRAQAESYGIKRFEDRFRAFAERSLDEWQRREARASSW